MNKKEIELIAEEIASAINQGRFQEACIKIYSLDFTIFYEVSYLIEPKVGRYDFQRFANMIIEYPHDVFENPIGKKLIAMEDV